MHVVCIDSKQPTSTLTIRALAHVALTSTVQALQCAWHSHAHTMKFLHDCAVHRFQFITPCLPHPPHPPCLVTTLPAPPASPWLPHPALSPCLPHQPHPGCPPRLTPPCLTTTLPAPPAPPPPLSPHSHARSSKGLIEGGIKQSGKSVRLYGFRLALRNN